MNRIPERPDCITGKTPRVRTGCGNAYVTYSTDPSYPYEVTALLGKTGGCARANLEAITRVVTLALLYGCPEELIIKHLKGIDCPNRTMVAVSCPEAVAKALEEKLQHMGEDNGTAEAGNEQPERQAGSDQA